MVHNPCDDPRAPSEEGSSTREAGGIWCINAAEPDSLLGHPVDVGRGVSVIAHAAKMVWPQGIDVNVQNPHACQLTLPRDQPSTWKRGGHSACSPLPYRDVARLFDGGNAIEAAAKHDLRIAAQPIVQGSRIDLPEVDLVLNVAILQVEQIGVWTVDPTLDP